MKFVSLIFFTIALLFSYNVNAIEPYGKTLLDQVAKVNYGWRPVLGKSLYKIKGKDKGELILLALYDTSKPDANPGLDDVQVAFVLVKHEDGVSQYKLVAVFFSSMHQLYDHGEYRKYNLIEE